MAGIYQSVLDNLSQLLRPSAQPSSQEQKEDISTDNMPTLTPDFSDTGHINEDNSIVTNKSSKPKITPAWWKEASVYQVYPCSFKDSNGDGVGDIPGLISNLDHIEKLGVDIMWICPIYRSPQIDNGYDISDYRDIHPPYGTLEDVDRLIKDLHSRGIKFLMDLVVNHSSDQHEWFKSSRSSKSSPYRDWYIWKPAKYSESGERQPPNNWGSVWGGSAWEWDETTQEYYLHIFDKSQPDLNWETPAVRDAVHSIMRFWLDKGVDGFRMDVINFISKDQRFPDDKSDESGAIGLPGVKYWANGPRMHEYLQGLGKILKEYDAFSVGEMPCVRDEKEILKAVGADRGELAMIFHFEIVDMDHGPKGKYSPRSWALSDLERITNKWQRFMIDNNGWNALYLENHDQSRTVSHYCSDSLEHRAHSAKMLATFIALQSGTLFIYQGEELGMINVPEDWKMEDWRDLEVLHHWKILKERNASKEELDEAQAQYRLKARDNSRTPMQWDESTHAGFTTPDATPWIKVNPSFEDGLHAKNQIDDPQSPYNYWTRILKLRKKYLDVFIYGDFKLDFNGDKEVFVYERIGDKGRRAVILCNWTGETQERVVESGFKVVECSYGVENINMKGNKYILRPWEAVVGMWGV